MYVFVRACVCVCVKDESFGTVVRNSCQNRKSTVMGLPNSVKNVGVGANLQIFFQYIFLFKFKTFISC